MTGPRPTRCAAALIAAAIALPCGAVLAVLDWLVF
jgi:hypothetical protein